jgi:hypothetical protein
MPYGLTAYLPGVAAALLAGHSKTVGDRRRASARNARVRQLTVAPYFPNPILSTSSAVSNVSVGPDGSSVSW